MFKYYFLILCLGIFFFCSCGSTSGISGDVNSIHKQRIAKIKEGALLVRLYVMNPKLEALKKLSNNAELSEEKRSKAQSEYEKLKIERNEYVVSVINAFEENYNYSAVYYIPDSLFKNFMSGARNGVFYNPENYSIDESIHLNEPDYIIYATGKPEYKYTLLDSDLQVLTRPKRYYGVFSGSFLADIFPFIKNEQESRIKSVQNLNQSFQRVWDEVH